MEPLFKSAHDALRFAFNFSSQQYERPLMNRLMDSHAKHASKGLLGVDGAAQAAMIINQVLRMPDLSQYIIFAQYAPLTLDCECGKGCCAGTKPNIHWDEAIREISRASVTGATSGVLSYRHLRETIVRKLFGDKTSRGDILKAAEFCGLEERQAYRHQSAIKLWLDGPNRGSTKGVRVEAGIQIDSLLTEAKITQLDS